MFRTSYVHHQEDCIVRICSFIRYVFHAFMQAMWQVGGCADSQTCQNVCTNAWKTHLIKLHVQYSLPDGEHKMFETCRRQEKLNKNINLKSAVCWLTSHKKRKTLPLPVIETCFLTSGSIPKSCY